ncbi:unnamed protein product, partial [Meganyctiphanes norvegica]
GGTPIPSLALDYPCDSSTTTVQDDIVVFPDLAPDFQSPFSCEHIFQGPSDGTFSIFCPGISLIEGCFKETITFIDGDGSRTEFFCEEDIQYSSMFNIFSLTYDKEATGRKDCPGKFFCMVFVEKGPVPKPPTTLKPT